MATRSATRGLFQQEHDGVTAGAPGANTYNLDQNAQEIQVKVEWTAGANNDTATFAVRRIHGDGKQSVELLTSTNKTLLSSGLSGDGTASHGSILRTERAGCSSVIVDFVERTGAGSIDAWVGCS